MGPKVKVEFRHLFSRQKRFSLCSSHKINANINVFCLEPMEIVYNEEFEDTKGPKEKVQKAKQ